MREVLRRISLISGLPVGGALLAGCSEAQNEQWMRWGLPEAASDRAPHMGALWNGAWLASLAIGVLVWALILFAVFRYRRRHADPEVPRQTRYNLPMELLYTVVPFLIIGVLFIFTLRTQDVVQEKVAKPQHTINVLAQKWSWSFNYMEADSAFGDVVHDVGTIDKIPDLYLPVGETVRFVINAADVNHSFWIPAFYFKLDAIPGLTNTFDVTPTKLGEFNGKCAELCGAYHANMLFTVHVVSAADYAAHLQSLKAAGQLGEIKGPLSPSVLPSSATGEK